jgi:hypothetical protein
MARDEAVVGCVGVLVVATRGAEGPGEVTVTVRGGTEAFIAWSAQPLPRGSRVLVVDSRGARQVDVIAWADPTDPLAALETPDAPEDPGDGSNSSTTRG